jgi:hypothetical protein
MKPIHQFVVLGLLGALAYGAVSAQGTKGTQEGKDRPGCCRAVPDPTVKKMTLQAPEFQLLKGQEVLAPIWLIKAENVANINWTLTYDAKVAVAEPLVTKGNLLEGLFEYNANEAGIVRFGFAQTNGVTGTGTVAVLKFKAVGEPGSKTPFTLEAKISNDPKGTSLTTNVIHGFIQIIDESSQVKGDCDGDGQITILDAQCALKMSVGLIPTRKNMDMDGDGQVTSRDAVMVLQQVTKLARLP